MSASRALERNKCRWRDGEMSSTNYRRPNQNEMRDQFMFQYTESYYRNEFLQLLFLPPQSAIMFVRYHFMALKLNDYVF